MIELEKARWKLAMVWFPGTGVVFLLLVGQSIGGAYGAELQRVWGWALPNFIPTLALMLSVFSSDALKPPSEKKMLVRRHFCNLSVWLSVFYLGLLLVSILSPPLVNRLSGGGSPSSKIEILEHSNFWLAPVQGLVVIVVGVLFFLKEDAGSDPLPHEPAP